MNAIKRDYKKLKRDIKIACVKKKMKYDDLSAMTGYSVPTIRLFMMNKPKPDREDSPNVAAALIVALQLNKRREYQMLLTQITSEVGNNGS